MNRYAPLLLLILCACSPTAANFSKPGMTIAERELDEEYCRTYAEANFSVPPVGGLAGVAAMTGQRNNTFKLCMMERGWREMR